MSYTKEEFYGGSEELTVTGTTSLDGGVRVHVIVTGGTTQIIKLPSTTYSNLGIQNHWVFNFGTASMDLRNSRSGALYTLPTNMGVICSLVDKSPETWQFVEFAIDSGPAPPAPVNGYIPGGRPSSNRDDCREYSPGMDAWTRHTDTIPYDFWEDGASFVIGDNMYMNANHGAGSSPTTAELTTPDTWVARTGVASHHYKGSGCGLNDGSATNGYLFGGYGAGGVIEATAKYAAPPTDTWSVGIAQAVGHADAGCAKIGDVAYVCGGREFTGAGSYTQTNYKYDVGPVPDVWTTLTDIPNENRGSFASGATSEYRFVLGGLVGVNVGSGGTSARDTNLRYKASTGVWDERALHPLGRRSTAGAFTIADIIYWTGGVAYDGPIFPDPDWYHSNQCHSFDDSLNSYTTQAEMSTYLYQIESHAWGVQT